MPPAPKSTTTQNRNVMIKRQPKGSQFAFFYKKYVNFEFIKYLLFDPVALPIVAIFIILAELVLNVVVIQNVPYTEIDWIAYMQECEGFLNGTTNYALLKGDTGPLVYPAGFVYIYSALYFITSQGHNIRLAQYIFCVIYLLQIWLVMRLYSKSGKVPPYVLVLSTFTSYRIHSIYVLRLFNDPVAILFLFAALNLFLEQRWTFGSVCYSLGVAVKMNILLFAPALFLLYITNLGYRKTFQQLLICASVQIVLGLPFLLSYPLQYLRGSFDLGRVFEHKWTVNYRFLSRNIFENNLFHLSLLIVHIGFLVLFAKPTFIFFKNYCRLRELQQQLQPQINRKNLETKKIRKPAKNNAVVDEEFTKEQMNFLNSFERGLKMEAGKTTTTASSTPIVTKKRKKEDQNTNNVEKYSINFDKCTQLALLPLLLSNFIGIVCARSLHYQFYVWYFHSLPYLTWSTDYTLGVRYLLLGLIEFCWNTYPSTNFSSVLLHWCHIVLLYGVGRKMFVTAINSESAISKEGKQEKSLEMSTSRNERKSD